MPITKSAEPGGDATVRPGAESESTPIFDALVIETTLPRRSEVTDEDSSAVDHGRLAAGDREPATEGGLVEALGSAPDHRDDEREQHPTGTGSLFDAGHQASAHVQHDPARGN
ncbi:hypothetical protein [Pseudonocardia sp. GCM10023141]|uniref:hypothetical protein n=1 Tax=Pseudonocardia sp. GCM10023141 TaxID=3252653 RepID=UPI00360BC91F